MRKILYLFLFLILFSFLGAENQAGTVLNREEITTLAATNIFDLISLKTGMIYRSGDEQIYSAPGKRARIGFYLNGMKIDENVALELNLSKFESIEILTNNVPPKYSDFTDGVILLKTRKPDKPINAEVNAMRHSDYLQNYDLALSGVVQNSDFKFRYNLDTELSANDTRFKDEFGADPNKEIPNFMDSLEVYDYWKNENPIERDFMMGNFTVDYKNLLTLKAAFLNEKIDSHPYNHGWRYAMEYSKVTEEEDSYLNFDLEFHPTNKINLTANYNGKENSYSEHPNKIGLDDYFTQVEGFDLYALDDNNRNYSGINVLTNDGVLGNLDWIYLSDGNTEAVPGFRQPGSIYGTYYDKSIKVNELALDFCYELNESSKLYAGYSYSQQVYNYSIVNHPYIVNEIRYEEYLSDCNPIESVMEGDPVVDNRPDSPTYGDTLISAAAYDLNFYSQEDLFSATEYASGGHGKLGYDQNYSSGYLSYKYQHKYLNVIGSLKLADHAGILNEIAKEQATIADSSIGGGSGITIGSIEKYENEIYPALHLEIYPNTMVKIKLGIDTHTILEPQYGLRNVQNNDFIYVNYHYVTPPTLTTSEKIYSELSLSYKFVSNLTIGYQVVDEEKAYYIGEYDAYQNSDYLGSYKSIKGNIFNYGIQLGEDWILSPGYNFEHNKEEISSSREVEFAKSLYNLKVNFGKIVNNPVVKNLTMDIEYLVQDGMPYIELNEDGYPVSNSKFEYMKPTKTLDLKLNYFTETSFGELTAYVSVKNLLDRKNELYVYPKTGSPTDDGEDLSDLMNPGYVSHETETIHNLSTASPHNVSEGMTLQFGLGFRW